MNKTLTQVTFDLEIQLEDAPLLPPQFANSRALSLIPTRAVVMFTRTPGGELFLRRLDLTGQAAKKDGTSSQRTMSQGYWTHHTGDREGQLVDAPPYVQGVADDALAMLKEQLR